MRDRGLNKRFISLIKSEVTRALLDFLEEFDNLARKTNNIQIKKGHICGATWSLNITKRLSNVRSLMDQGFKNRIERIFSA